MTLGALILAAAAVYRAPLGGALVWDILLLGLLLAIALAIVAQRRLFTVVMLGGAYSLVSAAYLVVLDAVDVAFTEAAVGAGVSTILMLGAMLLTARQTKRVPLARFLPPLVAVTAAGAVLLYATVDMPGFGDPESPANAYIGRAYLVRTPLEIGAPNVVTAVLASYRGYDTLGETVVIFTAGLGVMLLLGLRDPGEGRRKEGRKGGGTARGRAPADKTTRRPASRSPTSSRARKLITPPPTSRAAAIDFPSPLAGEGVARSATGEGRPPAGGREKSMDPTDGPLAEGRDSLLPASGRRPSPGALRAPPSPARGEGEFPRIVSDLDVREMSDEVGDVRRRSRSL